MGASSIGFDDEAKKRKKDKDELAALPSPSRETRTRHSEDMDLRLAGYKIHSRPTNDEQDAVWMKNGILFKHSEALLRLPKQESVGGPMVG